MVSFRRFREVCHGPLADPPATGRHTLSSRYARASKPPKRPKLKLSTFQLIAAIGALLLICGLIGGFVGTLIFDSDDSGDSSGDNAVVNSSELLDDVPSDLMDVEKVVDRQLEAAYLLKLLKELSPLEQAVTVYRYGLFDNPQKSYEQLSAGLDLPKQSLRNAFKRALAKLRKRAKLESQREIGNGFGSSLLLRG